MLAVQIRMFCAGSCLSPRFPESAGGGWACGLSKTGLPGRLVAVGAGHAVAQPSRAWPGPEAGRGRSLPPRSGLRTPLAVWLGPMRHPCRPGPPASPRPWRARSISAWADPAASRAWAASCPAFRARDSASPARRPAGPQRRAAARSTPAPLRPRAAAHSHSPDRAHLRTSCPVLAIGGLRSAHRHSATGRRRVAGTGAFRRPDDHPAGSGTGRGPGRGFARPRLSTCPQPRLSTCTQGTYQRIYPNHPQTYPQGVTLGRPKGCR